MTDFLASVALRGAGLSAAVSPRRRLRDAELSVDAEPLAAVDADTAPGVATDGNDPRPVTEPRSNGPIPEPVLGSGPGRNAPASHG